MSSRIIRVRELSDGVELLQAWFSGRGFDTHRHDTYAIGLTDVVLHPDETHDGGALARALVRWGQSLEEMRRTVAAHGVVSLSFNVPLLALAVNTAARAM